MSDKPKFRIERPGHIVVLDQQWHQLFAKGKPFRIANLERKLNKLLKEQGKVNTEYEAYKKLKKQLMEDIVANMDDDSDKATNKQQRNSRYINEINRKFEKYEERKSQMPSEIEAVNSELLTESMILFYKQLMEAKEESRRMEEEIEAMKAKLTEAVGLHEDKEEAISKLYSFMHDIAGFEAIEKLDQHFFGGDR